jgi:Flp pilus assembly protein TadG
MFAPLTRARARLRQGVRAVVRSERGAAAVEMALVATPFLMLLFGILELGMIFLISSSLENAMDMAARTVRTGQFQTGGTATAAAFKTAICNNFSWPTSACNANLYVDVRTYSSFSSVTAPQPVSNGTFNTGALTFNPGGPNDIVVVRAYYQWPLIAPMFDQALQQLNGGVALLTTTAAFRNEPYGS